MPTPPSFDSLSPLDEIGGFQASLPQLNEQALLRRRLAQRLVTEAKALEQIISAVGALSDPDGAVDNPPEAALSPETALATEGSPRATLARAVSSTASAHGTEEGPRGTEAVRAVMREGGVWTTERVFEEVRKRGWIDSNVMHPRKAIETALNRLHGKYREIERVGRGRYRYKTAPTDQTLLNGSGSAEP